MIIIIYISELFLLNCVINDKSISKIIDKRFSFLRGSSLWYDLTDAWYKFIFCYIKCYKTLVQGEAYVAKN